MKQKIFLILLLIPILCFGQAMKNYEKFDDKVIINLEGGELFIIPLTENSIRVQYADKIKTQLPELVFIQDVKTPDFEVNESKSSLEISTSKIKVVLDKNSASLSYYDDKDNLILAEKPGSRVVKSSRVQGENCNFIEQSFISPKDEFIYGTGQFQDGYLNIKGLPRRLTQVNTQISIPFIISNKGYGLFWHNYSRTEFNPADKKVELKTTGEDGEEITIDVTTTEGTKKETRQDGNFSGTFEVDENGEYAIMLDVGQTMARKWHVSIDGEDVIYLKNHWLPPTTSKILNLSAGKHKISVMGEEKDEPVIYYKKVTDETVFRSPVAENLDYIVFAGNADEVIDSYRDLSGKAPLMPIWSLGYIHCRERFKTQEELLENAKEFRSRKLPIDMIVQDWQYWGKYGWNAMQFDENTYPDPAQMVKELHDMDMRLMLSVWSRIDKNCAVGKEMEEKGLYIPNSSWVDFFNPKAAECYWKNFSKNLLMPNNIDAWWQDGTEPENDDLVGRRIANGSMAGEKMQNVYPLYVTKTVYEGSRKDKPENRVFILTRSSYSGQQRYAAAVWSGDVGNDFETLRRQITSGLNYSVTGMPYWTFDVGGFFRPGDGQYEDTQFHERFLRWFQFATFSPLQRVHGYQTDTEFWRYGDKLEAEALKYLNFRYRLLPYIYSETADITFNNGTIMRPLVMNFSNDENALKQNYEYMFGASLLVAPVVEQNVKEWNVYLPKTNSGWVNFWTGKHFEGGQTIKTEAPLSTIPLFVKAGSIIPLGKKVQSTSEQFADTLEIRIYKGADAKFELYEDEGTNYNYENGDYSVIPFEWDEQNQTLVIGKRQGDFNGLIKDRVFNIVWVNESNGIGIEKQSANVSVKYYGKRTEIKNR